MGVAVVNTRNVSNRKSILATRKVIDVVVPRSWKQKQDGWSVAKGDGSVATGDRGDGGKGRARTQRQQTIVPFALLAKPKVTRGTRLYD